MCAIFAFATPQAAAQIAVPGDISVAEDQKMLLAADEMIYNNDTRVVVASGGVQIDYGDYQLVADRVEYDQNTGRVKAIGSVEMIEPGGNRIYADDLDVTDNFSDGFLNALRIETPDNTRIAAESAERSGGSVTTFNNGVYTACEPCQENPERAPFWQVKAQRVIQNGETKTIRMERATFELFGMPIAYLPYLEVPDHDSKRKSGFLTPSYSQSDNFGYGLTVPYYLVISPYMDATFTGTGYTKQGFLGEAEFRQNFANGEVTLRMAGISQRKPGEFDAGKVDADETERGMIGSTGEFRINPRWTFGWDAMVQTDNNFSRTYGIEGFNASTQKSEVYLTGLSNRSYFDLRAYSFDIQDADKNNLAERKQAVVHPSLDYKRTFSDIAGGELSLDVNGYSLSRETDDTRWRAGLATTDPLFADRYKGFAGSNSRLSAELEWKRTFTAMNGLRLTPILAARGDLNSVDVDTAPTDYDGTFAGNGSHTRGMVTVGLEASYPVLVTTANSSHVIEPIAQIFVRPDEQLAGGLPNEDAQSFVFDATSLFERDKFTGFDRAEGGTRANVGVRYTGQFDNGFKTQAVFGQSYHLAGLNSFATPDLSQATRNSGLEDDVSDFVGMVGVAYNGFSLATSARFDKDDFRVERTDVRAGLTKGRLSTSLTYSEIKAPRPNTYTDPDRREITGLAKLKIHDYWSVAASTSYDLVDEKFNSQTFGILYEDECFAFSFAYQHTRDDDNSEARDWSIGARISFRTLAGFEQGSVSNPLLKPSF
ncbi:MAG: LPS-assembly protein LptD [Hoeflea sp.]|uniref:LPS-assembly protein LptD n=1 Tax=Hoeflea sp. TaxID=1940281 RepID=UPI00329A7BD5